MRQLVPALLCLVVASASCRNRNDADSGLKEAVAPAAAAGALGLKPVLVFESSGSIDEAQRTKVLEAAGRAGTKAFSTLVADVTLGKQMPSFALFAHAVKAFDDALADEAASGPLHEMLKAVQGNATIDVTLLMVDAATPLPADAKTIAQAPQAMQAIGKLLQLAAPRLDSESFDSLADRVATYAETGMVTGDASALRAANTQAYKRVVTERKDDWVPMLATVGMTINDHLLEFHADSRIKPAHASQLVNDKSGVVGISVMDYVPALGGQSEPAIAQFKVARAYNANGVPTRGIAGAFRFGYQSGEDLRQLLQCGSNCRDEAVVGRIGRNYPTIRGYFNPDKLSNYATLNAAMKTIANAFAQYDQASILLRNVGIDFSNPAYPRVAPELSSFAIVLGDGNDSLLLSAENNLEFRGFDLYNGIIASKVAAGLGAKVRTALAQSNQASAVAMAKRASQLAGLLNAGVTIPPAPMIAGRVVDGGEWHCMDQGASEDGSFAYMHPCHGGDNQRFVLMPDRTLTLINTGLCLDLDYGTANAGGNRLYLFPCHGNDNQRWTVLPSGQIQSDWRNASGGTMCIDTKWNSPNPNGHQGFEVYAFPCNGAVNQTYRLATAQTQLEAPTNTDKVACCTVSRVYEYWSDFQKWRKCDYAGDNWLWVQSREIAVEQADTVYLDQGPRDCGGKIYSRDYVRVTKKAESCVVVPRTTCQ